MAAGPLMLKEGEYCDWSMYGVSFIQNKHLRSVICLKQDNKVLRVTHKGEHKIANFVIIYNDEITSSAFTQSVR